MYTENHCRKPETDYIVHILVIKQIVSKLIKYSKVQFLINDPRNKTIKIKFLLL